MLTTTMLMMIAAAVAATWGWAARMGHGGGTERGYGPIASFRPRSRSLTPSCCGSHRQALSLPSVGGDRWRRRSRTVGRSPAMLSGGVFFFAFAEPTAAPTPAYARIQIISLQKINGVEQSFLCDFYMYVAYREPALFDVLGQDFDDGSILNATSLQQLRVPVLELVNTVDATTRFFTSAARRSSAFIPRKLLESGPNLSAIAAGEGAASNDTWVAFDGRYSGQFRAQIDLQAFPYDFQRIEIILESNNKVIDDLEFFVDPKSNFLSETSPPPEWIVVSVNSSSTPFTYDALGETYSRVVFSIFVQRRPDYYVKRIVTGVVILVVISAGCFFLEGKSTDRASIAATTYLGVVTYLFIVTQDVPKVSYTTRLDTFISLSQWMIFINFVVQIVLLFVNTDLSAENGDDGPSDSIPLMIVGGSSSATSGKEPSSAPIEGDTSTSRAPVSNEPFGQPSASSNQPTVARRRELSNLSWTGATAVQEDDAASSDKGSGKEKPKSEPTTVRRARRTSAATSAACDSHGARLSPSSPSATVTMLVRKPPHFLFRNRRKIDYVLAAMYVVAYAIGTTIILLTAQRQVMAS